MVAFLAVSDADASRGDIALVRQDGTDLLTQPLPGGAGSGTVTEVTGTAPIVVTPGGAGAATYNVALAAGSATQLIFPNVAALESFNVGTAGSVTGQTAVVTSNGSLWTLDLAAGETFTVDNITIASVTGGPGIARWLRSNANLFLPVYLAQGDWWVDPAAGNDEADGLGPGTALKTHAEVFRRWGNTWEPTLRGDTAFVIHQVTAPANGNDPLFYAPNMVDGGQFVITAPIPVTPAFTGTLNVVTAKNPVANQALTSSFTTTTGAIAANMLLVNATRGNSRAFALRDTGGGVWLISQPLAAYVGGFPLFTEVDTWAHGDAITGIELVAVDLARVGSFSSTFDGSANVPCLVENVTVLDAGSADGFCFVDKGLVVFENVLCERGFDASNPLLITENVDYVGGITVLCAGASLGGGSIGAPDVGSSAADNGASELLLANAVIQGALILSNTTISTTYVDALATLQVANVHQFGALYGPGELNVLGGNLESDSTGDATVSLTVATKRLAGVDTFYGFKTTGGATAISGGVALTSANINANGGFAFGPAGSISMNGLQP